VPQWLTAEEMKVTKERIDFILVSPVLSTMCIDAKIFNIGEIGYLSDQYPVQEVFNWAGSE
jgi:exonuclease III